MLKVIVCTIISFYLYLDRLLHLLQWGNLCVHHTLCLQGHTCHLDTGTPLGNTHI